MEPSAVFSHLLERLFLFEWFPLPQSDKLQEQQDLIEELQCHLSTPTLLGLGLNLRSRPHTAPMGSLQHSQNGGCFRQVRIPQSLFSSQHLCLGLETLQIFQKAFLSCCYFSESFSMLTCGCVCFQLGTCDQDGRLLEEELAELQQAEEENQFTISQERQRCVFFVHVSVCGLKQTWKNIHTLLRGKYSPFNRFRPINLTWTKKDLLSQGLATSGLPAHYPEPDHPCLARKACKFFSSK